MIRRILVCMAAAMLVPAAALGQIQIHSNPQQNPYYVNPEQQIDFVPYVWFSGFNGTLGALNRSVSVHAPFSDVFDQLNFGAMAFFDVRKNRFIFSNDLIYTSLTDTQPLPAAPAFTLETNSKLFIDTPALGLRLIDKPGYHVDANAGIRIWHLSAGFTAGQLPQATQDQTWVDPVVGMSGGIKFGGPWFINAEGDFGGWGVGADLDWQLFGALGRTFARRFSLAVAYRYLSVDYKHQTFLFDTAMQGPQLGFGFHW